MKTTPSQPVIFRLDFGNALIFIQAFQYMCFYKYFLQTISSMHFWLL